MKILVLTSEWPTDTHPEWATFIVDQVESLRALGGDIEVFPFRGDKNPIKYLFAWLKVQKKLIRNHYDIVHAHFGQSGLLALPKDVPLVATFHGSDLQGYLKPGGGYSVGSKPLRLISRLVARNAELSIVVSGHLKRYLPEGIWVEIVPCGIDFKVFRPMQSEKAILHLGLNDQKRYVLFPSNPGRIVKRYSLAEETISIVKQTLPDVELMPLMGVAHDEVPYYINASSVVLLTSYQEGSPTVVKEALACNTPVVSVDVGDVRDMLEGIEGCKICDDRPEVLAAAIIDVMTNYEKIESRERVQNLDLNVVAGRIFKLYRQVVGKGVSAAK